MLRCAAALFPEQVLFGDVLGDRLVGDAVDWLGAGGVGEFEGISALLRPSLVIHSRIDRYTSRRLGSFRFQRLARPDGSITY